MWQGDIAQSGLWQWAPSGGVAGTRRVLLAGMLPPGQTASQPSRLPLVGARQRLFVAFESDAPVVVALQCRRAGRWTAFTTIDGVGGAHQLDGALLASEVRVVVTASAGGALVAVWLSAGR